MLRGILYCGGCDRPMATSSSKAVSLKRPNAHSRYYRCRGTATQPACKPPVQVAAAKIEQEVSALLRDRNRIASQLEAVAAFVDVLRSEWKSMGQPQTTEVVRRLVWRATWKPKEGALCWSLMTLRFARCSMTRTHPRTRPREAGRREPGA